jgi:hypothetical protein
MSWVMARIASAARSMRASSPVRLSASVMSVLLYVGHSTAAAKPSFHFVC